MKTSGGCISATISAFPEVIRDLESQGGMTPIRVKIPLLSARFWIDTRGGLALNWGMAKVQFDAGMGQAFETGLTRNQLTIWPYPVTR